MYRKDQLVFYGNTGACRVADVAPLPQQKDGRLYYTLIPLFSPFSETIHVSVSLCIGGQRTGQQHDNQQKYCQQCFFQIASFQTF